MPVMNPRLASNINLLIRKIKHTPTVLGGVLCLMPLHLKAYDIHIDYGHKEITDHINKNISDIESNTNAIKKNSKFIEENSLKIDSNQKAITTNTDKTTDRTITNRNLIGRVIDSEFEHAEKINANSDNIIGNRQIINTNTRVISDNRELIHTNTKDNNTNKSKISNNISDITKNRTNIDSNIKNLKRHNEFILKNNKDATINRKNIETNKNKIEMNSHDIIENRDVLSHANDLIFDNTQRIDELRQFHQRFEQKTATKFAAMDKRIGENHRKAMAGISSAMAMSAIPFVEGGRFSLGLGGGTYGGQGATAMGAKIRVNSQMNASTFASLDSTGHLGMAAGISYGW